MLKVAGYLAFFLAALLFSAVLTFDAGKLKPLLKTRARQNNLEVRINDISVNPLIGFDFHQVRIMPLHTAENKQSGSVKIKSLSLEIPPAKIPGIILSTLFGSRPSIAVDFEGKVDKGNIKGSLEQTASSLFLEVETRKVPMEKLDLAGYYVSGMKITGELNGNVNLDLKDLKNPATWEGNIMATIDQPAFSDFKYADYTIAGVSMSQGMLSAKLAGKKVNIEKIKLEGEDLPVDLTGTVSLRKPLNRSMIDLKGKVNYSKSYQERMPLIKAFIPSTDNYHYHESLGTLIPGL
ncbi:MAG: type II secretion system protein GspN [bacterium]